MPNVLLEAQVLKTYIISSNCPTGPREILLKGKAGSLFKVGDYIKLSNLIQSKYFVGLIFSPSGNLDMISLTIVDLPEQDEPANQIIIYEILSSQ